MSHPPSQSGIQLGYLDSEVAPSVDFYQFANGGWETQFEIPADKAAHGAFYQLADRLEVDVQNIYKELEKKPTGELNDRETKVLAFYRSFMNDDQIETNGLAPVQPWIDRAQAVKSTDDWFEMVGNLATIGVGGPAVFWVLQDRQDTSKYVPILYQSGLALPDRDYYLPGDDKLQKIKHDYQVYLADLFQNLGWAQPEEHAKKVVAFETAIAEVQWSKADNRNPKKTFNPMTVAELEKQCPTLPWQAFFKALSAPRTGKYEVYQPTYLTSVGELIAKTDIETLKSYSVSQILHEFAPVLPKQYADRHFDFFSRQVRGIPEQKERWKRAQAAVDQALGEAVGELYVTKHFSPDQKKRVEDMVGRLFEAMKKRIENNTWMSDETKAKAMQKLAKMNYKIGYPKKWRDYSSLAVSENDVIKNLMAAAGFERQRQLKKLEVGVDRDEWHMLPHTVNAYYHPQMVEIVFPAAILKPPMFYADGDDAVNFGAIGAVIGHEITHGFDDNGRQFDADGNLADWWRPQDAEKFQARAKELGEFFGQFEPVPGSHINPQLTMGENIADLGGVNLAWEAYGLVTDADARSQKVDGFTRAQLFFVAHAQVWASKYRPEEARRRIKADPHSPGKYRVVGIFPNVAAFYDAFEIPEGSPMYRAPQERVSIW